jgi:hypothetical protein
MHLREHRRDSAAVVFGAVLLLVGGFYLLRNTLGLSLDIDWDAVWPIAVIVIGAAIVIGALNRANEGEPKA